jgi:hypothetical protein
MTTEDRWAAPIEVDDVTLAFPARVVGTLRPPYDECTAALKAMPGDVRRKWERFQADWFFSGLKDVNATPADGVDPKAALRHLSAIQGSYEPKHEHKEAAVAYLASRWFTNVEYVTR